MKKPPKFDGTQHCVAPSAAAAAAYAGDSGSSPAAAKMLCHGCAFLDSCRSYALTCRLPLVASEPMRRPKRTFDPLGQCKARSPLEREQ